MCLFLCLWCGIYGATSFPVQDLPVVVDLESARLDPAMTQGPDSATGLLPNALPPCLQTIDAPFHITPVDPLFHVSPMDAPFRSAPLDSAFHSAPVDAPFHIAPVDAPFHSMPVDALFHISRYIAPLRQAATGHGHMLQCLKAIVFVDRVFQLDFYAGDFTIENCLCFYSMISEICYILQKPARDSTHRLLVDPAVITPDQCDFLRVVLRRRLACLGNLGFSILLKLDAYNPKQLLQDFVMPDLTLPDGVTVIPALSHHADSITKFDTLIKQSYKQLYQLLARSVSDSEALRHLYFGLGDVSMPSLSSCLLHFSVAEFGLDLLVYLQQYSVLEVYQSFAKFPAVALPQALKEDIYQRNARFFASSQLEPLAMDRLNLLNTIKFGSSRRISEIYQLDLDGCLSIDPAYKDLDVVIGIISHVWARDDVDTEVWERAFVGRAWSQHYWKLAFDPNMYFEQEYDGDFAENLRFLTTFALECAKFPKTRRRQAFGLRLRAKIVENMQAMPVVTSGQFAYIMAVLGYYLAVGDAETAAVLTDFIFSDTVDARFVYEWDFASSCPRAMQDSRFSFLYVLNFPEHYLYSMRYFTQIFTNALFNRNDAILGLVKQMRDPLFLIRCVISADALPPRAYKQLFELFGVRRQHLLAALGDGERGRELKRLLCELRDEECRLAERADSPRPRYHSFWFYLRTEYAESFYAAMAGPVASRYAEESACGPELK